MCISPKVLADGIEARCHECWQCRAQAVNDWVGRNIAESITAKASHMVTLTYGRGMDEDRPDLVGEVDHMRSAILTYSDVQKFIKLLRFHGFPVRYFATGEYGGKNGRAHWHVMLYWQDKSPAIKLDQNLVTEFWPHGYTFWRKPNAASVRYCCKYVQKAQKGGTDIERQGHMGMSKKPPLGAAYFRLLAQRYVDQGLAPQDLSYSFPDVLQGDKPVQFMLEGRSGELYLDEFLAAWGRSRPGEALPPSPMIANYVEHGTWNVPDDPRRYYDWNLRRVEDRSSRALERAARVPRPGHGQLRAWMFTRQVRLNPATLEWEAPGPPGAEYRMVWRHRADGNRYCWQRKS